MASVTTTSAIATHWTLDTAANPLRSTWEVVIATPFLSRDHAGATSLKTTPVSPVGACVSFAST
jgi:hypothetical protein